MKTNIFKKLLVVALIGSFASCTDDFLDVDKRGLTEQEEFYQTDAQALSAVVAAYDILQSMYAKDWNCAWLLKEAIGGQISQPDDDQDQYYRLSVFEHTAENSAIQEVFNEAYYGIYRANKVIEKVEPDTDAKKMVVGEARFLRALFYFDLVNLFGKVPLVTSELSSSEYAQPSAEIADIWSLIETDLTEAVAALPVKSDIIATYGAPHAFRASKGAARALLGKAYLYQEKYDEAAAQFKAVIDSEEYGLVEDFADVLRKETEFGEESLFEISYSTEEGHTWSNNTFPWGNGRGQENNIHWQLAGPRGDGYFEPGSTGLIAGWGHGYPRPNVWNSYAEKDSIRRNATVMSEEQLIDLGGDMRSEGELHKPNYGFIRLKYGTWASETNMETQAELNYGTNIRLIRYADVLLLAAEAYHLASSAEYTDDDAREFINLVRDRVEFDPLEASDDIMEAVRYERNAELAFEGHRFFDLKRWELAADSLGQFGYQSKHEYLPIPQAEIDINPELDQNPAWTGG